MTLDSTSVNRPFKRTTWSGVSDGVSSSASLRRNASTCASAQIAHVTGQTTVSVNFGTGCTVPHIGTVSGSAAATIGKLAGTIRVSLAFTNLAVNGLAIDGTLSLATTDATTFTAEADLSSGANHVTFTGSAIVDANLSGVTLSGTGTFQAVTFHATGIHHGFGTCYADAGSLSMAKNTTSKRGTLVALDETVAFSTTTPATGQVIVTINGQTSTTTLATYGTCPHG